MKGHRDGTRGDEQTRASQCSTESDFAKPQDDDATVDIAVAGFALWAEATQRSHLKAENDYNAALT